MLIRRNAFNFINFKVFSLFAPSGTMLCFLNSVQEKGQINIKINQNQVIAKIGRTTFHQFGRLIVHTFIFIRM